MNKVILLISLFFTYPALGISVSVNSNCDNGAIRYNFGYTYNPDLTIKISNYENDPDYSFKELMDKVGADIVVGDNNSSSFSVCKSYFGKKIKVSTYAYDPGFTIKVSTYAYDPDYKIFNDSKFFTTEEIISILLLEGFIE